MDGQTLLEQLLKSTANIPALVWIKFLQIDRYHNHTLDLTLSPSRSDLVHFVGDPRQKTKLSQLLSDLVGHPVKVNILMPQKHGVVDGKTDHAGDTTKSGSPQNGDRLAQGQKAMELPLVREVIDAFDVYLLDVREQSQVDTKVDEEQKSNQSDINQETWSVSAIDRIEASDLIEDDNPDGL